MLVKSWCCYMLWCGAGKKLVLLLAQLLLCCGEFEKMLAITEVKFIHLQYYICYHINFHILMLQLSWSVFLWQQSTSSLALCSGYLSLLYAFDVSLTPIKFIQSSFFYFSTVSSATIALCAVS